MKSWTSFSPDSNGSGFSRLPGSHPHADRLLSIGFAFGSNYWPVTPPGRMLTFILALYALAVFGYITAALASFFIGSQAQEQSDASTAVIKAQIETLRAEVRALTRPYSEPGPKEKPQDTWLRGSFSA